MKIKMMEEIEMKTQVFKNRETIKSSNSMMFLSMIIFIGILLFASNYRQSLLGNSSFNVITKHENEKLNLINASAKEAVNRENEKIKTPFSETEFSMAKMQDYLIPENEPEPTIDYANSIVIPDIEMVELAVQEYASNSDHFLQDLKYQASDKTSKEVESYAFEYKVKEYLVAETEPELEAGIAISIVFPDAEMVQLTAANSENFLKDLQNQANEKTREAVEYYAFEEKVKEYLAAETEQPLKLEDWMINEKCWCHKSHEAMALTAVNNSPFKQ